MPSDTRPLHPLQTTGAVPDTVVEDLSCDPREYLEQLSNAGRWGSEDWLGTLNFVTPEVRAAAAGLVREGLSVGCSFALQASSGLNRNGNMQRFMTMMPKDFGPRARAAEIAETVILSTHGFWVTHVDAPNHLFWDGMSYNGLPDSTVTAFGGGTAGDIATLTDGIVSRGVLLDVAGLLGVECLEAGHTVTPEELEAAEERQGVRVQSGDIVLLRTGYGRRYRAAAAEHRSLEYRDGIAGWHPRCLPWLYEREAALIGTDGSHDPEPSGFEHIKGLRAGIHFVAICRMGLWLMDWCNLEELHDTCERLARHEFLLTIGTLRLSGCSATPVQPIALF